MAIAQQLLAIVPAIYDAALDPLQWSVVLERLVDIVGGHCATIMQGGGDKDVLFTTHGYSIDVLRDYYGAIAPSNMFADQAQIAPAGMVQSDTDILPKAAFRASQFYNEFLHKHLHADAVLTGMLWREKSDFVALNICRDRNNGSFEAEDKKVLRILMPHFRRAISTSQRIFALEDRLAAVETLLDRTPCGAIVTDQDGRVIYANRSGETLLQQADAITVSRNRLRATTPAGTAALHKLICETALGCGGVLALERSDNAGTIYATATPLRPELARGQPNSARVLLLLRDPLNLPEFPIDYLRELFGLTVAEARVATLLQQGHTTAQIASVLSISVNTARVHLNALLGKTATHRQPELMRLLMGLPPVLVPSPDESFAPLH